MFCQILSGDFQLVKGTATALLTTTYQWFKMLEEGNDVCAVGFFNSVRKAFDSIPHRPLLTKLSHVGLDANIVATVGG